MSYVKAEHVLPQEIIQIIQEYADGLYLYIPKKSINRKSWGDNTETKQWINKRNREIYHKYLEGTKALELAEEYFLSIKSIQRIILNEKRNQKDYE